MTQSQIDDYIISNRKYFPSDKLQLLKNRLITVDESRLPAINSIHLKNPLIYLLVSIFLGPAGIDRFLIGSIGMGILKLFTGGLFCILWISDICTIQKKVKEMNYNLIMQIL